MLSLLLPSISNTDDKQRVYMNYGYKFETVLDTLTSNSEIHLIRSLETGEAFISKVYDIYGASENDLNRYMNELHIMQKLENCENVVQVVDFIKQNDSLSLITEFCSQGDLYTHILRRKMKNEMYTEKEIFNIFNQILNGLNSIHKNGITHGDLKSTNIFIKDDKIKIGDFGISQKGSNNNLGTLNFLSYESILFKKTNKLSDLFQVGCILYELATFSSPFSAKTMSDMISFFEDKNYKNYIVKDISNIYSDKLVNIISKLLSLNTLERLEVVTNYNLSRTESMNLEVSNNLQYAIM
ncbi:NIMA related kinase 3, putative [Plasmodium knowlesi strain H]|uniref:NIMA related kinase 3, putative n=3 Tax=Plasmodium knowlesi TaxID=5850 RepID=A0A5K1UP60_PLAKH|nr:NIMA related kinase 3, putative [Plasmodium knowlesi strain H]OTN66711.1 putative NIMA related kinase 3 [Plasmodium knowlesi]CAA9990055.1 NIMA related kinase 3, putative [Plasmodium knowlesi strain H]SBO25713.1 NIMA related kinase 3, putative [Plasmodium knowlesi strain H]SBO28527.1 NIMA related kinase 3, putative [Plasmodium knowlesi strain H]VVS79529.1 NIMA related kinase 3, putative [Plasmodium knowlesi strain H]|eukprot:XP_002260522.1 serine/threonine-protein kinase Nek1, putative [Plasmodium knowlesi strain H]